MKTTTDIAKDWAEIKEFIDLNFEKNPDTQAILYLIGVRELGILPEKSFSKADKVGLLHIAVCKLLSYQGYYELKGTDQDGWPHWEQVLELPFVNVFEQEILLRQHIIHYFKEEEILPK